jgi:hypothetical protein
MDHRFRIGAVAGLSLGVSLAGCADLGSTPRAAIVRDTACQDFSFPVYFKDQSDQLTTAAVQAIAESASRTTRCRVVGVTIIGLANGSAGDLALRRSNAVARAFVADGLSIPTPVTDTTEPPAGSAPMGRPTEVQVRLAAPR